MPGTMSRAYSGHAAGARRMPVAAAHNRGSGRFWTLLLVMSIVQFSAAWLYPASTFGGVDTMINEKAMGVPFQYLLWLLVLLALCLHVARAGFDFLAKALLPFLPFFLVGLFASVLGIAPFTSLRSLILWTFCALAAAVIPFELPARQSVKWLFRMATILIVLSVLLAVLVPKLGTVGYGTADSVWRGVFTNKNQLGWIATLILLVSAGMCTRKRWIWPVLMIFLSAVCVWKSGSKGALLAGILTLGYLGLVKVLRSKVTPALGVTTVLLALGCILIFGFFVMPELLAALGRDTTFTGRTFVWSLYFNSMLNTPFLGEGPGAYTALSELTTPMAIRLTELGAIVTPHNAFLGAFGDGGILGVFAFAGVLIYLGIVSPFLRQDRMTLVCAGIAFFNMAHGLVETHEVFIAGFGWFLMIFLRALSMKQEDENAAGDVEGGAGMAARPFSKRFSNGGDE